MAGVQTKEIRRFSRAHLVALRRQLLTGALPNQPEARGFTEARMAEAFEPLEYGGYECTEEADEMHMHWYSWKEMGERKERMQPGQCINTITCVSRNYFPPRPLKPWLEACARELGWEKAGDYWIKSGAPPETLCEQLMCSVLNWVPDTVGALMQRISQTNAELYPVYVPLVQLLKHEKLHDPANYVATMFYL